MEAAFAGDRDYEKLHVLRTFRNRYLLHSDLGQSVVTAYDRFCRPLADVVRPHEGVRLLLRMLLMPVVGLVFLFA